MLKVFKLQTMSTGKDPWTWSVDEVIHNLFGPNGLLLEFSLTESVTSNITNLIRESETDGFELLSSTYDPSDPQAWLSRVQVRSQRRKLEHVIEGLRFRSDKYIRYLEEKSQHAARFEPFSAVRDGLGHHRSIYKSPAISKAGSVSVKAEQHTPQNGLIEPSESKESPLLDNRPPRTLVCAFRAGSPSALLQHDTLVSAQDKTPELPLHLVSNPKRAWSSGSINDYVDTRSLADHAGVDFGDKDDLQDNIQPETQLRHNETFVTDAHGRKRRKLVLAVQNVPGTDLAARTLNGDANSVSHGTPDRQVDGFTHVEGDHASPSAGNEKATVTSQDYTETAPLQRKLDSIGSFFDQKSNQLAKGPPSHVPTIDPEPRSGQDEDVLFNTALEKQPFNNMFPDRTLLGAAQETIADHEGFAGNPNELVQNVPYDQSAEPSKPKRRLKPNLISSLRAESCTRELTSAETFGSDSSADVPNIQKSTTHSSTQVQKKVTPRFRCGYLGQQALPVDQIFYGNTMLGQPVAHDSSRVAQQLAVVTDDDGDDFQFVSDNSIFAGQRLYVSHLMKGFLRQDNITDLMYGNKHLTAVIPYRTQVIKYTQLSSMTLLTQSGEDLVACRVNRVHWLRYETFNGLSSASASRHLNSQTLEADVYEEEFPLLTIGRDEVHDYDFLEKWDYLANDRTLPAYGDSGSEGEYDLDTWREMEREKGRLDRIPAPPSQKHLLDAIRVREIMDSAENAFKDQWNLRKLPKLKPTAWHLWKSRNNDGDRLQLLITEFRTHDHQILKAKEAILKEQWTSEAKLKAQCKSFEVSVTERETRKWKIDTLQLSSEPPKLPMRQRQRRNPAKELQEALQEPLQDGEEDIGLSSIEGGSSDDDIDDFIVSDDESNEEEVSSHHSDPEDDTSLFDDPDGDGVSNATVLTAEPPPGASRRNVRFRKKAAAPDDTANQDAAKLSPVPHSSVPKIEKLSASKAKSPKKAIAKAELIPIALSSSPVRPSIPDIIDLTNLSDEDELLPQQGKRLATPPVFVKAETDNPFLRSKNAKCGFRMPPAASSEPESGLRNASIGKQSSGVSFDNLPPPNAISQIAKLHPEDLIQASDRERLLIWIIGKEGVSQRKDVIQLMNTQKNTEILQLFVWQGMRAFEQGADLPEDLTWDELSINRAEAYMRLAKWFVCWSQCTIVFLEGFSKNSPTLTKKDVAKAIDDEAKFVNFYGVLTSALSYYAEKSHSKLLNSSPSASASASQKKRIRRVASGSEESDDNRNHRRKKRVYEVPESQQALELQRSGQQRIAQQNRRQKEMDRRMKQLGETGDIGPTSTKVVNISANPDQGVVIVPRHISLKIQAHQLNGVRFMWREVVAADQGCLLAHTMGLGKTMQVITLLVTIAQAAKSEDESIRAQIPERLRSSKTLILAPPSLVDNWFDEFLMWAPDRTESVGNVYKVGSDIKLQERLAEIELWDEQGGVLLMGYDGFRNLVIQKSNDPKGNDPKSGDSKSSTSRGSKSKNRKLMPDNANPIEEARHKALMEVLFTHPNLIVLDEAHTVKRASSKISQAVAQFKSTNRIALTGSPLSNNLEEYYELVSWIAPGYLGTRPEFRAKYGEPIASGLYAESTAYDRRKCLMKLATLSIQLEPKMQRQDISVLKKQLSKTEFVIYVPLTTVQRDAYVLYAETLLSATSGKNPNSARIWGVLSVLRLLCNHPKCFRDKLKAVKQDLQNLKKAVDSIPEDPEGVIIGDDDDESIPDDAAEAANTLLPNIGMTEDMLNKQLDLFKDIGKSIAKTDLSNKMLVLMRIIAFSEEAQDKVLVFSHSIPTLDFIGNTLKENGHGYERLDGKTLMKSRNQMTKRFNKGKLANVCLISTRAGGQGLNLYGANRVVIVDDHFNPMNEEQAIGRAYRIGQEKHVYVYRLTVGGTFEETIQNQSLFKIQLATRVVDKKHNNRFAMSSLREYLRIPRELIQTDLTDLQGKDELVLDRVLAETQTSSVIRSIVPSETFKDLEPLTAEEEKEVKENVRLENLAKSDPAAYRIELDRHERALQQRAISEARARDQTEFNITTVNSHLMTTLDPTQANCHTPQVFPQETADHVAAQSRATGMASLEHVQRSSVKELQRVASNVWQRHGFSDNMPVSNAPGTRSSIKENVQASNAHSPSPSVASRQSESSLANGNVGVTERQRIKYRDRICSKMTALLPILSSQGIFKAENAENLCRRLASRMEKAARQKAGSNNQAYRNHIHDTEKWVQNDSQQLGKALQLENRQAKSPTRSLGGKPSSTTETANTKRAISLSGLGHQSLRDSEPLSSKKTSANPMKLAARPARFETANSSKSQQTVSPPVSAVKDIEGVESTVDGAHEKNASPTRSTVPNVRPISAQLSMSTPSFYPSLQALLAQEQCSQKLPSTR